MPICALTINVWVCVCVCVCVCAVEAAFRRLLFQYKFMPPRDVLKQRLGGLDLKHSKDLQGSMIWFLINKNVRYLHT